MKLKNIVTVMLLGLSLQAAAQGTEGMTRMPNGIFYKIYNPGNGAKAKLNDVITFNFIQKTDQDSVLLSSWEQGRPVTIGLQPSRHISDLMDFFPLLSEGDSALVKVPVDSLFTDPQMQRPSFFPPGSFLQFVISMEKVQSMEQAMADQQRMLDSLKSEELATLDKFISDKKLKPSTTPSGLRYLITKKSSLAKPVAGDTLLVNYTGRKLDGKVFDSSIEAEAKKAGLEQPGRKYEPIRLTVGQGEVIKGWDEGLLLLNKGSKAMLFVPSELAYGARGAGDEIEPFSSLIFDVELVDVKPAKK